MDSKTLLAVAEYLTQQAHQLAVLEKANAPALPVVTVGNVTIAPLASGGGQWPGDPAFPGSGPLGKDWKDINGQPLGPATPDSMWQVTLRSIHYNNAGDPSDCNKIVREKHARGECGAPIFPDARQEWEL